jgi:hypothetical protein
MPMSRRFSFGKLEVLELVEVLHGELFELFECILDPGKQRVSDRATAEVRLVAFIIEILAAENREARHADH